MNGQEHNDKSKSAALFGKVMGRDRAGHVKSVLVPGTEGKQYQVIIRWTRLAAHLVCETECNLLTGPTGLVPCKGNEKSLCYHSKAAILIASNGIGRVSFCLSRADADRLARLYGGSIFPVASRQSAVMRWAVFQQDNGGNNGR